MTNSNSEPKEGTPVSNEDVPNVLSPQDASSSSSNDCTHEETSETGVVARCLKRRRSSEDDNSSSNNYPPGFFTPEQEENLRKQREKIERIKTNIKQQVEKMDRADACIKMFQRWPELISHLGSLASTYGEQALQDLVKKIDDENLSVTDPLKKIYLLFTFFRNRRDMNIRIKNIIHQHILNLNNEMGSGSSVSSDQNAICKYKY